MTVCVAGFPKVVSEMGLHGSAEASLVMFPRVNESASNDVNGCIMKQQREPCIVVLNSKNGGIVGIKAVSRSLEVVVMIVAKNSR